MRKKEDYSLLHSVHGDDLYGGFFPGNTGISGRTKGKSVMCLWYGAAGGLGIYILSRDLSAIADLGRRKDTASPEEK